MEELNAISFSPTGTTHKIVTEIAKGISISNVNEIDLTHSSILKVVKGVTIIGAPVYEGRLPKVFVERLNQMVFVDVNCILVVVYGNRAFDDALLELKNLVENKGAKILGAGAFIGEHSLSNNQRPVAMSRPDIDDLEIAFHFGEELNVRKYHSDNEIKVPGNFPYREISPNSEVVIKTDLDKCTNCGDCISACPVGAISNDNPLCLDGFACLRCCACIKICPVGARELIDPLSLKIANKIFTNCQQRKEPIIYL